MRVLLFSTLYPNAEQPHFGLFVRTRLQELLKRHPVQARVMAPVPWFPSTHPRYGRYARFARVPAVEVQEGMEVLHPRYALLPKVGLWAAAVGLALACLGPMRRLMASGFDFDVIDAHFYYPDGAAAALLGRWLGKPVCVTARGSDINLYREHPVARRAIAWTGRSAAASVGVSRALVDSMASLGVPNDHLHFLPNGVDTDRFQPQDPQRCRAELGLPSGPLLLAVANLVELKGHALMLQALPELLKHHPRLNLAIVGEGELRAALERQAHALGVKDKVFFAGAQAQANLPRWYSAADLLLLPSSREGWPNVLLESMACGTPVLASRVGGTPEIVTSAAAGELLPQRDAAHITQAVLRMLAAPRERAATREHALRFGWAATSQAQFNLFQALAARPADVH